MHFNLEVNYLLVPAHFQINASCEKRSKALPKRCIRGGSQKFYYFGCERTSCSVIWNPQSLLNRYFQLKEIGGLRSQRGLGGLQSRFRACARVSSNPKLKYSDFIEFILTEATNEQILSFCSTSPKVEPPNFVEQIKSQYRIISTNLLQMFTFIVYTYNSYQNANPKT